MKHNALRWLLRGGAILLVGYCVTSVVFSQVVLKRKVVIDVIGEPGTSITAIVTVDGEIMDVTRELPTQFTYHAKHVVIEAAISEPQPQGHISASLYVDDSKIGFVVSPASQGVRVGYKAPGLLGQGKSTSWVSGISANDLAAMQR